MWLIPGQLCWKNTTNSCDDQCLILHYIVFGLSPERLLCKTLSLQLKAASFIARAEVIASDPALISDPCSGLRSLQVFQISCESPFFHAALDCFFTLPPDFSTFPTALHKRSSNETCWPRRKNDAHISATEQRVPKKLCLRNANACRWMFLLGFYGKVLVCETKKHKN